MNIGGVLVRIGLKKYFTDKGFKIEYVDSFTFKNYNGRSFYNDGTYQEEVYKISSDTNHYFIHDKSTGRPRFVLKDKSDNVKLIDFSQRGFIERLEEMEL